MMEVSNLKLSKKQVIGYGCLVLVIVATLIYPQSALKLITKSMGVVFPIILGAALAYVLNLLCSRLEQWYFPKSRLKIVRVTRRPVSILLTFVLVLLVLFGVLRLVLPQFANALSEFFESVPKVVTRLAAWIQSTDQFPLIQKKISTTQIDWTSIQSKVMKYFTTGISGVLGSTITIFSKVTSGVVNFVLAVTFAIYILISKEKLGTNIKRVGHAFLSDRVMRKLKYYLATINQCFSSFIIGQVTEAFVLGTLCIVGMLIFRFPYAVSIGAFVGMMALIPIFGAWIGAGVGFLLIVVDSPFKAVLFIVFILVLQQIEGNLIYPKVVGTSIGLPGIWVLAAITIGSGISGILGMLLGVPVAATLYKLLKDATNQRLSNK
jgi:predicted PurR-regulated permease PerM